MDILRLFCTFIGLLVAFGFIRFMLTQNRFSDPKHRLEFKLKKMFGKGLAAVPDNYHYFHFPIYIDSERIFLNFTKEEVLYLADIDCYQILMFIRGKKVRTDSFKYV